jgi:hypothetical protein
MAAGLESGRVTISNSTTSNIIKPPASNQGVVYRVILDENDEVLRAKNVQGTFAIGSIQFRLISDKTTANSELPLAFPVNKNINTIPTRNEQVFIHENGGDYYYTRLAEEVTPQANAIPTLISTKFPSGERQTTGNSKQYSNVQKTNIPRSSGTNSESDYDGYGDYFELLEKGTRIHKLKLYEGDTLLESRFGQSIRFSGYNNSERAFSPTITIRNGENPDSLTKPISNSTEEDINTDGSIIVLGSGEKKLNFTLPTTIEYESFYDYPSELKGNQILLNSDRIILSAKTEDMIIVGKKNIGMITDGKLSLDARGGINITSEDNLFIDTKNKTLNINIGNGKINLGTDGELDYALKGNVLLDILREFMEIVGQQIFVTPAGATSPGPTNNARLNTLIGKLNDSLSKNIQLK